jgi:hypothetical protein
MRATFAILVVLAAAVGAPGAAGAAGAAGAEPDKAPHLFPLHPCYRSAGPDARETVGIVATNFTPGGKVNVTVDGTTLPDQATANEKGEVFGSVLAPYNAHGTRRFGLTLTDVQAPEKTASQESLITALDVRLRPRQARPSSRVRFLGRGFIDGPRIYGHYLRAGKLRRTVKFGRPTGPCGRLDVVRRQIPVRRPATGRWTLQVDTQRAYSASPRGVFVRVGIVVKRVAGRG